MRRDFFSCDGDAGANNAVINKGNTQRSGLSSMIVSCPPPEDPIVISAYSEKIICAI